MNLGIGEIALVVLVILLLFGGKRMPETARQLGRGISELRRSYLEAKRDLTSSLSDPLESTADRNSPRNAPPHSQPRDSSTDSQQAS
ncbi:MAG: twin-arginine translocase TatA/TatE family subunit [Calditrichaeota bacterium]|nr:twin-arginine translocase TatA/TatE family subunit [Calditrichota bacterium]MCB9366437.1 twin-arginine translocase TatA/TatE family subunit [Calditrichota bacterium]